MSILIDKLRGDNMSIELVDLNTQLASKLRVYQGLSFNDIAYKVGINPQLIQSSKLSTVTLVRKMLEYANIDEKILALQVKPFQLSIKTVRLKENGISKESMSFEQINFMSLVKEQWNNSFLYKKFNETIFLFIVFQYQKVNKEQVLFFKGTKVWKMPQDTLNGNLKTMWERTKKIVENGVELVQKKSGNKTVIQNNLPGMDENPVAHIRPKAKDSNDKIELPDGQIITKQAYWLNANYISDILNDLPLINRQKLTNKNNMHNFSKQELEGLQKTLTKPIYTIEEFHLLANESLNNFNLIDITHTLLDEIDYKIDSQFILSNQYKDVNEYFEEVIFKENYFQVPDNEVFQNPFTKRKLENLENAYRLVKLENNLYITDTCLKRAEVQKDLFLSYKNDVEQFVNVSEFFTLSSLRSTGFHHDLDDFGFENLFYESILKLPGRLKSLKIKKHNLFIKSAYPISNNDLIVELLGEKSCFSIDDMILELKSRWNIIIDYDYAIHFAKSTDYYYSEELEKVFQDKDAYYNYVYSS